MVGISKTEPTIEALSAITLATRDMVRAVRFYEALGGCLIGEREYDEEGVMLPEVIYGWADIRALVAADSTEPAEGDR